jgi:hypothetical protein
MPFREKTAWISAVTTLLIWGYYASRALPPLLAGRAEPGDLIGLLSGCVVLSVLIQIVLNIVAAILSPRDARAPKDERERLFELKSHRIAYFFLAAMVATVALASSFVIGASPDLFPANPLPSAVLVMGNLIFFSLIVADLIRVGALIVQYRRAA